MPRLMILLNLKPPMKIRLVIFFVFCQVITASAAKATLIDTLPLALKQKFLKPVKIGPENFFPPALPKVDTILLRNLAIDARYKKKEEEGQVLKKYLANQALGEILSLSGIYTSTQEQNISSLTALLNSYRYAEDLKNQILLLNTIAAFYVKSGDPEKSIGYYLQSLQLLEQLKDKEHVASLTSNIAGVFKLMGNYGQALTYYEYSQKTNTELKKYAEAASGYIDIASVKMLQQKYTEAENLIFKKALPLSKWSKPGRMRCFSVLAEIYLKQNRLSEAKWYYLQENKIASFLNDQQSKVASLINIAQLKSTLGDQTQALEDLNEAEILAKQNRYLASLVEIKGEIGEIYLKKGDYDRAGTTLDEYTMLKDSLLRNFK